jgi:general secretion pathway protein I
VNPKTTTFTPQPAPRNLLPVSGFTLLELMVAISIIALVLVSINKMHAQTISMNYAARFYASAPLLAQLKLSELETEGLKSQSDGSGDFGDEFPGYRWEVAIDDVESETMEKAAKDLRQINITIFFNKDEFKYKLRTYRFLQE